MTSREILSEVSDLCGKNKIIPFLGAGCSATILQCDWDSLMQQISEEYDIERQSNLQTAQKFINKYGKEKFCSVLNEKLTINEFDDEKGYVYLAILAMAFGIIYTTNQDNVLEKCCKKYGFKYNTIVKLEDLIQSEIGKGMYIKYHGDYKFPDSVIFGEDDYLDRIDDKNNFLDIRLKSDMLGRKILFVGYSFRDINLKLFFRRLGNVFGKIPESYMIIWKLNDDLENECRRYNIKIINPNEIFPNIDTATAYFQTIELLCDEVFQKKTSLSIHDFFNHKHSQRVISKFELNRLANLFGKIPNEEYIHKFREKMDRTLIPTDFETDIVKIFIRLASTCGSDDVKNLHSLLFNLELQDTFNIFIVIVYFYVAHNKNVTQQGGYELCYPFGIDFLHQEELLVLALTTAFEILRKHNIPISDFYRGDITSIITDRSMNVNLLPVEIKQYIVSEFDTVWKQKYTTYEHPIKRQNRLKGNSENQKHDKKLVCDIYAMIHDKNKNPYFELMNL